MAHTYKYPRPALCVDCVVFGVSSDVKPWLKVLLIKRAEAPFLGQWALPGGHVEVSDKGNQGEDLETAARRELKEETGIEPDYLEQLYTFGSPGRDPRGRVVSVVYNAFVRPKDHKMTAGSDAAAAEWFSIIGPDGKEGRSAFEVSLEGGGCAGDGTGAWCPLAFDHHLILKMALERLQTKVRWSPIGFNLLPPKFTLGQLQGLYEAVLMRDLDKRNFRKRILSMDILASAGVEEGSGRPGPAASLYRFDKRAYDRAVRDGFNFEI